MLRNLLRTRPTGRHFEALYALAVEQARVPAFYTTLNVADRIDARFELYTLHVLLLVLRLRDEGSDDGETAQALFNVYVSSLDHALRELGVGDISVGKKMRKLGEALYGRMTAYEAPLRASDRDGLAAALARNVYEAEDTAVALALADYALASRATLAAQSLNDVIAAPRWGALA